MGSGPRAGGWTVSCTWARSPRCRPPAASPKVDVSRVFSASRPVTLGAVSYRPGPLPSLTTSPTGGRVEYLLARNAVVREFKRGRLSRLDVCDAHPELLRAAVNLGRPTGETCPICEEADLVDVTFVFGSRLPPGGRCVASQAELARYWRRKDPVVCYVVEVCAECSWNHLARMYPAGAQVEQRSGKPARSRAGTQSVR
jgi:hypothetical protein